MKAFKFNLETFLKVRRNKEESMRMELARQNSIYQKINQDLYTVMEQQHNNRVASDTAASIGNYIQQCHYQNTLRFREQNLLVKRENCSKDLRSARENFVQAKKESTVLELLEKRQYDEYRLAVKRQQQIDIGERANQAWRKKHG